MCFHFFYISRRRKTSFPVQNKNFYCRRNTNYLKVIVDFISVLNFHTSNRRILCLVLSLSLSVKMKFYAISYSMHLAVLRAVFTGVTRKDCHTIEEIGSEKTRIYTKMITVFSLEWRRRYSFPLISAQVCSFVWLSVSVLYTNAKSNLHVNKPTCTQGKQATEFLHTNQQFTISEQ